jgi:hypothetical protein
MTDEQMSELSSDIRGHWPDTELPAGVRMLEAVRNLPYDKAKTAIADLKYENPHHKLADLSKFRDIIVKLGGNVEGKAAVERTAGYLGEMNNWGAQSAEARKDIAETKLAADDQKQAEQACAAEYDAIWCKMAKSAQEMLMKFYLRYGFPETHRTRKANA